MTTFSNISLNLQGMKRLILGLITVLLANFVSAQVLQPLGTGLPGKVVASYATESEFFALYEDVETAQPNDYTLARWNGVFWQLYPGLETPEPVEVTEGVYNFHSIVLYKNTIYVGAYIANASKDAEVPVTHLYKWSESKQSWVPEIGVVDTRNNGIVSMSVFDDKLMIAGQFESTVAGKSIQNIAVFNGSQWDYMGTSDMVQGANGLIRALQPLGNRLYMAGNFSTFAGGSTGNIAYYTAANGGWGGIGSPFTGEILDMATYNGSLAVLGTQTNGTREVRIFKGTWSSAIDFTGFSTANIKSIAGAGDNLVLAGDFVKDGNGSSLLVYDGSQLSFTGNRLTGQFSLGQRGSEAFVWGDFKELNTDLKYFSTIVFATGNLYGDLYFDLDGDCIKDGNEIGIPESIIRVIRKSDKQQFFTVSDKNGHFTLSLPEGDYTVEHMSRRHMYSICTGNYATQVRNGKYSSVSLGEYMSPTTKDLEVALNPIYPAELKAGDTVRALLVIKNHGAQKVNSTIHVAHDLPLADFESFPEADNYDGIEATYSLSNLEPFETRSIILKYKIPHTATAESRFGLYVKTGSLSAQNDAFQNDNFDTTKLSIGKRGNGANSVEKVADFGSTVDYRTKTWLYTVNFRNTGSSFVKKAVMIDTLSTQLPLQRILLKSFYPVKAHYSIQKGRILVVTFDPADLKTYESSPTQSTGWVQYQLDFYEQMGVKTQVDNIAYVNFDSKWVGASENCQVMVIDGAMSVNKSLNKNGLKVYPNPVKSALSVEWLQRELGQEYQILDMTGRVVLAGTVGEGSINVVGLNSGIYLLNTLSSSTRFQVLK